MHLVANKTMMVVSMRSNAGFSLIEVMIAVLVLSVGILGAGALQTVGLQTTQGAYFRSQSLVLAEDIVDRMRVNRSALATYAAGAPAVQPNTACLIAPGGCAPAQMAAIDMWEWSGAISNSGALPNGAAGTVVAGMNNSYVVTVRWNENEWAAGGIRQNSQLSTTLNVTIIPN